MANYEQAAWFFKRRVMRYDIPEILIASQLYRQFRPLSVFDMGCGIGSYLAAFFQLNCRVRGCELGRKAALPYIRRYLRSHVSDEDISQPLRARRGADLVLCLEVAEHIPLESHPTMWANIHMLARGAVLFSAGLPTQPGYGHVACQSRDKWIAEADAAGLEWHSAETREVCEAIRTIGDPLGFTDRLLVFRRKR